MRLFRERMPDRDRATAGEGEGPGRPGTDGDGEGEGGEAAPIPKGRPSAPCAATATPPAGAARTLYIDEGAALRERRMRSLRVALTWFLIAAAAASYLYYFAQTLRLVEPPPPLLTVPPEPAPAGAPLPTDAPGATSEPPPAPLPAPKGPAAARPTSPSLIGGAPRPKARAVDPREERAYAAYRAGDFALAGRLYREIAREEPDHRRALLGLAAVAVREQRYAAARTLYRRLLEGDAADPLALAGLINIDDGGDRAAAESALRLAIAAHPAYAYLYFALGNLYAARGRWAAAREAYAGAVAADRAANTGDRPNPDYLFNLAVSLDRIDRPQEALPLYHAALAASEGGGAIFDSGRAFERRGAPEGEGQP